MDQTLTTLPRKLLIAVSFHYVADRLRFLDLISSEFGKLADEVSVCILTNTLFLDERSNIERAVRDKGFSFEIKSPSLMGHPYLLTWSHLNVFSDRLSDPSITHFLYVEDDILIQPRNVAYWMRGRETLRPHGLIPSFLRFEVRDDEMGERKYSTDSKGRANRRYLPQIQTSSTYCYLNLPYPYQGMYLLDRQLMAEYLSSPSFNPDLGKWGIREKAAQGATFLNVPPGFRTRNVVGFDLIRNAVDEDCLIHHTPNNYANDPKSKFGKIPVSDLVFNEFSARKSLRRIFKSRRYA